MKKYLRNSGDGSLLFSLGSSFSALKAVALNGFFKVQSVLIGYESEKWASKTQVTCITHTNLKLCRLLLWLMLPEFGLSG